MKVKFLFIALYVGSSLYIDCWVELEMDLIVALPDHRVLRMGPHTPIPFSPPSKIRWMSPRAKISSHKKVISVRQLCPGIPFGRIWRLTKSFLQILVEKHNPEKIEKGLWCVTSQDYLDGNGIEFIRRVCRAADNGWHSRLGPACCIFNQSSISSNSPGTDPTCKSNAEEDEEKEEEHIKCWSEVTSRITSPPPISARNPPSFCNVKLEYGSHPIIDFCIANLSKNAWKKGKMILLKRGSLYI